jgi:hypothetical protein
VAQIFTPIVAQIVAPILAPIVAPIVAPAAHNRGIQAAQVWQVRAHPAAAASAFLRRQGWFEQQQTQQAFPGGQFPAANILAAANSLEANFVIITR